MTNFAFDLKNKEIWHRNHQFQRGRAVFRSVTVVMVLNISILQKL